MAKLSSTEDEIISPQLHSSWEANAAFTLKFAWFQNWVNYLLYYKTIK